jgi:glycosyltransferase involved in cell wall biosynthesis
VHFIFLCISGKIIGDIREVKKRINLAKTENFTKKENPSEIQPLVSIVIPTKNEAGFLEKLLESIKNQSYKNIEVIVVDYKSDDGTVQIARSFGARVIEVSRKGVGYATHVGFENAKGDIIIRTDADAIFPPELISNTVKRIRDAEVYHVSHLYYDGSFFMNLMAYLYDKYWRKPWETTGHFIAVRKEFYRKVQFNPDMELHEDWEFGWRAKNREFGWRAKNSDAKIHFDLENFVLVSARRIKKTGLFRYILGFRKR